MSDFLAGIKWSVCISKSHRLLLLLFYSFDIFFTTTFAGGFSQKFAHRTLLSILADLDNAVV